MEEAVKENKKGFSKNVIKSQKIC